MNPGAAGKGPVNHVAPAASQEAVTMIASPSAASVTLNPHACASSRV
jgi:hypothetical protein